jgi:hypothetical protein
MNCNSGWMATNDVLQVYRRHVFGVIGLHAWPGPILTRRNISWVFDGRLHGTVTCL